MKKFFSFLFSVFYKIPFGRSATMYLLECSEIADVCEEKRRAALIDAVQLKKLSEKSRQSIREMIWQMRPK